MIMVCTKQHLSNIWSSSHEKITQYWDQVDTYKKRVVTYKKSMYVKEVLLQYVIYKS